MKHLVWNSTSLPTCDCGTPISPFTVSEAPIWVPLINPAWIPACIFVLTFRTLDVVRITRMTSMDERHRSVSNFGHQNPNFNVGWWCQEGASIGHDVARLLQRTLATQIRRRSQVGTKFEVDGTFGFWFGGLALRWRSNRPKRLSLPRLWVKNVLKGSLRIRAYTAANIRI